jgi:hypothetical protein
VTAEEFSCSCHGRWIKTTVDLLKRFNRAFPEFYGQFVSSEIQLQNLRLAYQLYKQRRAIIAIKPEGPKSALHFALP